jgi:hypothetical protein
MARAGTRYPRPREREQANHAAYWTGRDSIASRAPVGRYSNPGISGRVAAVADVVRALLA